MSRTVGVPRYTGRLEYSAHKRIPEACTSVSVLCPFRRRFATGAFVACCGVACATLGVYLLTVQLIRPVRVAAQARTPRPSPSQCPGATGVFVECVRACVRLS